MAFLPVVGYLIRYFLERRKKKDDLAIEQMEIDNKIKYAKYLTILNEIDQPVDNLGAIRRQIANDSASAKNQTLSEPLRLSCSVSCYHMIGRAEGIADIISEIVLSFWGGNTNEAGEYIIHLSFNVNVTNRPINGSLDAFLVEQGKEHRSCNPPRARLLDPNSICFRNIRIVAPGPVGTQQYTITNVRTNIAQVPLKESPLQAPRIYAYISLEPLRGAPPISIANNMVIVARPILGLISRTTDPLALTSTFVKNLNTDLLSSRRRSVERFPFVVEFCEGFAGSFRSIDGESTELARAVGGAPDHGTRFLIEFFNIPFGISVFVSCVNIRRRNLGGNFHGKYSWAHDAIEEPLARLVSGCNSSGAGGTVAFDSEGQTGSSIVVRRLAMDDGYGFAVWELCSELDLANSNSLRGIYFGVEIANDGISVAQSGVAHIRCSLAPVSTVLTAADAPCPRFVRSPGDSRAFLSVVDDGAPSIARIN